MGLTKSMDNYINKPFLAMFIAVTLIVGLGMLSIPTVSSKFILQIDLLVKHQLSLLSSSIVIGFS
jgi:hypothetical protein